MDYKETLNLPKTSFPMKANLPHLEPQILKKWEEIDLYQKKILQKQYNDFFVLHDGPPYANGDIHIGHALNKALKDIIVKYNTMKGKKCLYVPGWDCHGLPVEHALFKNIKKTKHDVDILEFRKQAYKYAYKFVEVQKKEFMRLGIFGLWDRPYLTLDFEYESIVLKVLADLVKKGYVYRGLKPVNWCGNCETALAEAEVEYEEKKSPSVYIKFPFPEVSENTYLLVWTTTPWTLLGNVACAIHPDLEYVKISIKEDKQEENYIIAKNLIDFVSKKIGFKFQVIQKYKSKDLEAKRAKHPFLNRESQIILADFVSSEEGTGIVHIAPGHGEEDYEVGKSKNLPMYVPVDDRGKFIKQYRNLNSNLDDSNILDVPEWVAGVDVFKANSLIIDKLQENKTLLFFEDIQHSYPSCWRCNLPIIFRATRQWFMAVDYKNLRDKILSASNKVKWFPERGKKRFTDMIKNRPDWCLSRQRLWGIPIPAFKCNNCEEDIINYDIINNIAELVKKEGSDVWFNKKSKDLLPKDFKCVKCGSSNLNKLNDILDVWFESGVSHKAVLKEKFLSYPADLYLEGSDQHRGWFQTSMITSMANSENVPFKNILTHGFVVDSEGKKMSKSRGNVISPLDIFKEYGADILRLWVVSCDYTSDIKISQLILSNISDSYRKIRNTIKFMLGNLCDYSLDNQIKYENLMEIDKWVLMKLAILLKTVDYNFKKYNFYKIYRDINEFCVVNLSSFYLDILKDRLYIFKSKSKERRSAQTAIYIVLTSLIKILSPIMPFTSEQAWQNMPDALRNLNEESIHLEDFPIYQNKWINETLEKKWNRIKDIRNIVLKSLETEREKDKIGGSLEARVIIFTDASETLEFLNSFNYELRYIFIVSDVEIRLVDDLKQINDFNIENNSIKIKIENASGMKCQRCWNYSETVGKDKNYEDLCNRCLNQI